MPIRVLFFGFSVTEENGYVQIVQSALKAQDIEVEYKAIGGVNLWCVPYLHETLDYSKYDYVFFEVSTCLRYSESEPNQYEKSVCQLINQARQANCRPRFIHLYRDGIDYDHDNLLPCIIKTCRDTDSPDLNLVPRVLQIKAQTTLKEYF